MTEANAGQAEAAAEEPDDTAVMVAVWRAAHMLVDAPPHVLEDDIGLRLAAPDAGWLSQPVMGELFRPWRASIIGRARFVEDLAAQGLGQGVRQLVILGAGLDSLALRRADLMARLRVFEVDGPATQRWKRRRITAAGLHPPPGLFSCRSISKPASRGPRRSRPRDSTWRHRPSSPPPA